MALGVKRPSMFDIDFTQTVHITHIIMITYLLTHTYPHTYTHTYVLSQTHPHTHARTNRKHSHEHTQTHTHINENTFPSLVHEPGSILMSGFTNKSTLLLVIVDQILGAKWAKCGWQTVLYKNSTLHFVP